jgi:histone demethylase JARID1
MVEAFYKIEKESSIEPKPGYMKELVDVIGSPVKTPKKLPGCNSDNNQLDSVSLEKNGKNPGESSYNNNKHDENNVPHYAPPIIQLTPEALSELENILIEGNLMEISFEETLKLWKIYQSAQPKNLSIPDLRTIKYRIKKEIEGKETLSLKARKTRNGPNSSSGSTNAENSPRKRTSIQGKRKSIENNANGSSPIKKSAKVQEYDEDCAAESCRQPAGKEVNWVQCESECFKWFHLVCVGLKKSEVKKLESYQCKQCTQKKNYDENEIETEVLEDDADSIKPE